MPQIGTIANVTSGPSEIFIAPVGIAIPTLTGAFADFAGFTQPGFTQDGIEFDYTASWKDFMADEKLGPLKKKITGHKLVMSTKLEELTLANLAYAIPAATLNGNVLSIGSPDEAPEFVIGWRGPAPDGGTYQAILFRTVQIAAPKIHYQRKDMALINVQFEALSADDQPTAGDLGVWEQFPNSAFVLGG